MASIFIMYVTPIFRGYGHPYLEQTNVVTILQINSKWKRVQLHNNWCVTAEQL